MTESNTTYTTRDGAIYWEIIRPIEASGDVADARAEFDIDAIADEVLGDYEDGFTCMVDADRFWEIVAAHHIADGDPRIIWDAPEGDGSHTARLMQWSDDEADFIEIDAESIESSEDEAPYDDAEVRLAGRHGLDDVTVIWFR